MNPEKYSQHTALGHSLLWRRPLSYQRPLGVQKSGCHKQTNELARTGVSWRERNNRIRTNYTSSISRVSMKKSYESFKLHKMLSNQYNESPETKTMKQTLKSNSTVLQRSTKLILGMQKLKQMRLLTTKNLQQTKYPGHLRHPHIHNDYHERITNPGYSRNQTGKHYTK